MPVASAPEFARGLGLAGLFDLHTHFMPPNVTAKVRAQFDSAGPLIGRPWPLVYINERGRRTDEQLVETLRGLGVRRFTALSYAHRPGMAEWLNDWAAGFAAEVPEVLHCATLYPEDGAGEYVASRVADGARVFKVHVQVGNFDVRDPLLDDAWGVLAEASTPVVLHAGSGPVPATYTGPAPVADLLARHPRLRLVIAHAGAPEYCEFLKLAERHDLVGLDTTMAFTDFFSEMGGAYPADLLPRLRDLGLAGKVFLGSDFPNIPYPYEHQLEALARLELGDAWLRAVCWESAARVLGE
ncbi:amidohydrolase [Nocardioides rotundus]|uniref:amidohydrolase family protein n=1 Tax=Nocardioides rotundus TaxID=1774216 RepID=UPI001CBAF706|nr:amidohydrolase family protein [Nocardioides rotundus]UAL29089.1 amidohydrolase [Nocardioides rotundus]